MCTVSFYPTSSKNFILTSNRDEAPDRETLAPTIYEEEGVQLLYPKDALAGGTWIGVSERKRAVTLMNGGFVAHQRKSVYRKSRGLIVKDILKALDLEPLLENYDFNDIEPFTAVVVDWNSNFKLYTVVWDGEKLHPFQEVWAPKIWSSSPLYLKSAKLLREKWFSDFQREQEILSAENLLTFHKTTGEGDPKNFLIMDRGVVKTKSITSIEKNDQDVRMRYEDLQTLHISNIDFPY